MKAVLWLTTWVVLSGVASATDPAGGRRVAEWKWSGQPESGLPGKLVEDARYGKVLRIERSEPAPQSVRLAIWKSPGVKTAFYAVRGHVRYEDVQGTGYLEMWNEFGGGNRFFTRTMGEHGPMRAITGASGWRSFYLPFNSTGAPGQPTALEINLILAGKGNVEISDIELLEFADAGAMWAGMGLAATEGAPLSRWLIAAMASGAGVGAGAVALAVRRHRQRQDRELRRMRAHDAG